LVLAVYLMDRGRFDRFLARLPYDGLIRLVISFAPAALLAIVLLAIPYLRRRAPRPISSPRPARSDPSLKQPPGEWQNLRSLLASWIFIGGLVFSAILAAGFVGVLLYIILRS
jgi:hypothetical protein